MLQFPAVFLLDLPCLSNSRQTDMKPDINLKYLYFLLLLVRGLAATLTSPQGVRAVLGVLRLSTRGHRSLDSLLSDHWRQLLVLQSTEERVRGGKKKQKKKQESQAAPSHSSLITRQPCKPLGVFK